MEIRHLNRSDVLHRPGATIEELYFPIDCLVSITVTLAEGKTAEAGAAGSREVVGINAFMGGKETTQTEYITQTAGAAVVMPAQPLKEEFDNCKPVRDVLLKYTQAHIAYLSQNVACNRLHTLERRLARWLLEVRDRTADDELDVTQEFIGQMLGVGRPRVTETIAGFEAAGIISHTRGAIRVEDLQKLKEASCGCYDVVMDEYERLLGPAKQVD